MRTKTVATIVITKLSDAIRFMENPTDNKNYLKFKKLIDTLLKPESAGVYEFTIKRHRFGLYYTVEMRPILVPAKG